MALILGEAEDELYALQRIALGRGRDVDDQRRFMELRLDSLDKMLTCSDSKDEEVNQTLVDTQGEYMGS